MDTDAARCRRLYDRWAERARLYRVVERLSAPIRERALAELAATPGDTAVDVGCGPGGNPAELADAVGPDGRVLGVDVSRGMVRRARERVAGTGPVEVVRADATRPPLPVDGVDVALASLALSAMPGAATAVEAVADALGPGGRFVVLDGRAPGGVCGRPVRWLFSWVANWQPTDVVGLLRETFASVEVVAEYDAGAAFVAVAETR